jgi:hypothetical protein
MAGEAACLQHGGVDDRAQFLRSERHIVEEESAVLADPGILQGLDGLGQADLSHHQGGADFFDFLGGFELAFGKKSPSLTRSLILRLRSLRARAKGK